MIIAQEFDWIVNNEPSFRTEGRSFVGKVGRTSSGRDIELEIQLPDEYYPIVKPTVKILNDIDHPNIEKNNELALQLLEEWEPRYRVKDIIVAARRLFLKSKKMITEKQQQQTTSVETDQMKKLRKEVEQLQQELQNYSQKINQLKGDKLQKAGVNNAISSNAIPISPEKEKRATKKALTDLLNLIEYKFEDASMDEIVFFRLYRKYIKEYYLITKELPDEGGNEHVISKSTTKTAIRN